MTKPFLREVEVADGINVIIDDRFVAMFPTESKAQVEHSIESVNLAHRSEIERLRSVLGVALSEHDDNDGVFAADYMPNHWTHEARRALEQKGGEA